MLEGLFYCRLDIIGYQMLIIYHLMRMTFIESNE